MKNRIVYGQKDISYNEIANRLAIGNLELNLNYLFAISAVEFEKDLFNVTLRYKNSQYDIISMDKNAYDLLRFQYGIIEAMKIEKESKEDELKVKQTKRRFFLGIGYNFWILYIILIIGFFSNIKGDVLQNQKFDYQYVYNVNQDTCLPIENYIGKFSYQELNDPKFVGEFPKRPGELVFISLFDEMYVFTDTETRCLEYQKYFIEEMEKQIREDESKVDPFNIGE
jgi:hypothetical protein